MRVILKLESNHQKLWYDYLRLKFQECESLTDKRRIREKLDEGNESLSWLESVLRRKNVDTPTRTDS